MEKTVVELFAGVGGFRVGLERASKEFKTVWANQWEPSKKAQEAYECYIHNFGESENHSNQDINEVDVNAIPDHTLLVGGFPCQDYSVASTGAKGIEGKKGVLWWNIYSILEAKSPKFVLLENVDRLLKSPTSQRGRDFGVMLACFKSLNYSVEWKVINAAEYGFVQRRRRVFIFAYKNDTNYRKDLDNRYKGSQNSEQLQLDIDDVKKVSLGEFVVRDGGLHQKLFPGKPYNSSRINVKNIETNDIKEISDTFKLQFWNTGCLIDNQIYTEDLKPLEGKSVNMETILDKDVPERFYLNEDLEKWRYMKGSKKIPRTHKDGHQYFFAEGAIAFPDPIDRPARTMLTSEASANRSTHIIEDPETGRLRKLTPSECEALNGFDKGWTDTGMSERFRYFCMGNALVVGIVEKIGRELNKIIEKE